MNSLRRLMASAVVIVVTSWSARAEALSTDSEFFEKRIRPVLIEQCYECHSTTSKKIKGGLRADSRASLLQGGDTGPAITPGKPEASLIMTAISHRDKDLAMPPKKAKLPDSVVADFERWIREGAIWPGSEVVAVPAKSDGFDLLERKNQLPWIWQTPHHQSLPQVKNVTWPLGSVDQFILARLEREGLQPAPLAEPGIWLRRVYFTLIGLPPSPEQTRAFLNDPSPGARERIVDELLASPRFGERWARHWLDLVRYAESRGHESDFVIPNAHEYRDYVVRAINADVPYDEFVREHIAGDLLPKPRRHADSGFNESILGTGWAFLGEEIHAPVDTRQDENERIDNRIDVLTKTFLGLTVSCARCHDHKFDAITQRDYYALAGFFMSSGQRLARFETMENERAVARRLEDLRSRWAADLTSTILAAQAPVISNLKGYLTAASEAAKSDAIAPSKGSARLIASTLPQAIKGAIGRLATAFSLDPSILGHWTAALVNAANDPGDLLHPMAATAFARETPTEKTKLIPNEMGLPPGARVVVDYGKLADHEWYADGVGFGLRPVRAGELRPIAPHGTNGSALRFVTRAAAQSDPDWRNLDLSPGVEREPTMFGSWQRDGVMLRSPKFDLNHGKIHYLVRGSGRILATVDSQRLVTGPVHTVQVREWGYKDHWHWISQDLSDYAGHRVAVEFSPGNEFDTAIAMIAESELPPADPLSPGQRLGRILKERHANTVAAAALVYHEMFATASGILPATGKPDGSLEIESWLTQRPELVSGNEGEWPEIVARKMSVYLKERQSVLSGVQWKSRTAPAMMEGNAMDEYLLVRGKHQTPKGLVPRRFLESIAGAGPIGNEHGSGRWELAKVMTDPTNPLLSRVMVNRAWHHVFGRGIVASVDNFGWLGQRPTHPELLDDLATTFILEDHWSLKRLVRRLVLSRTFAMSSKPADVAAEQKDPENLLLHRMNLRRLEGEVIRDAMLAVSGRLDLRMFGPSIPLHPSQFVEARGLRSERGPLDGDGRRSLYVAARRNFLPMMMAAFDTPTPFTTVGRRNVSNVPGQMLFLMNDPFVHQQAGVWAKRIVFDMPSATDEERIRQLFAAAFNREPSATEILRCRSALGELKGSHHGKPAAALDSWVEVCHALFGVKEFVYVR